MQEGIGRGSLGLEIPLLILLSDAYICQLFACTINLQSREGGCMSLKQFVEIQHAHPEPEDPRVL